MSRTSSRRGVGGNRHGNVSTLTFADGSGSSPALHRGFPPHLGGALRTQLTRIQNPLRLAHPSLGINTQPSPMATAERRREGLGSRHCLSRRVPPDDTAHTHTPTPLSCSSPGNTRARAPAPPLTSPRIPGAGTPFQTQGSHRPQGWIKSPGCVRGRRRSLITGQEPGTGVTLLNPATIPSPKPSRGFPSPRRSPPAALRFRARSSPCPPAGLPGAEFRAGALGRSSGEGAQHRSAPPKELGNEMEQQPLPRQVAQERNTNGFFILPITVCRY